MISRTASNNQALTSATNVFLMSPDDAIDLGENGFEVYLGLR
jgi:hypothetical protein